MMHKNPSGCNIYRTLVVSALFLVVVLLYRWPFGDGLQEYTITKSIQPAADAPHKVTQRTIPCSTITQRHEAFTPLMDTTLCDWLERDSVASPLLRCQSRKFVLGMSPVEVAVAKALHPVLPPDVCKPQVSGYPEGTIVQGTAIGVPCTAYGCCDVPVFYRSGTKDCGVFQQIFHFQTLRYLYAIAKGFTPKYILDAGANVGFSTMLFKLLWPDAIVVSLEPDPDNFANFKRNTASFKGVHAVNGGLWGHRTRLLPVRDNMVTWGIVFKEVDLNTQGGIDAYSVKDLAAMFNISAFDFVKIDVEGAEAQIFQSSEDTTWISDTQMVSMELHGNYGKKFFNSEDFMQQIAVAFDSSRPRFSAVEEGEHLYMVREDLIGRYYDVTKEARRRQLREGVAAARRIPAVIEGQEEQQLQQRFELPMVV